MGIVQEIEISPYYPTLYPQPRIHPENVTYKILRDSEIQTDHIISARRRDQVLYTHIHADVSRTRTWCNGYRRRK